MEGLKSMSVPTAFSGRSQVCPAALPKFTPSVQIFSSWSEQEENSENSTQRERES